MSNCTFRYGAVDIERIASNDFHEGFLNAKNAQTFRVTIFPDGVDECPEIEQADALYLPAEGRLGIAWGADATWVDVHDVESGIEIWHNDRET